MTKYNDYNNYTSKVTGLSYRGFKPNTGNSIIDSCVFSKKEHALIVALLWVASEDTNEDHFIKSIPFLFRMYKVDSDWV